MTTLADLVNGSGKTQAVIAKACRVNQATVSGWVTGNHLPQNTRLPVLARALGMPLRALRQVIDADRQNREVHAAQPAAGAP